MADLQTVRTSIVGALQGVTGGGWSLATGRVYAGYLPMTRTTGSGFWVNCVTGESGACAFVRFGGITYDGDPSRRNDMPTVSCPVDVYCALTADAANSGSGVTVFIETIRKALHAVLNGGCTYDPPEMRTIGPVLLLHFTLSCEGTICGS